MSMNHAGRDRAPATAAQRVAAIAIGIFGAACFMLFLAVPWAAGIGRLTGWW